MDEMPHLLANSWAVVADYMQQPAAQPPTVTHLWQFFRTIGLGLSVALTLVAILLLYGGNIQNANIGPISIRSRTQTGASFFKAPRTIVSAALEGKTVRCTFYLSYLDRRGRVRYQRLARKTKIKFKLSALNKRLSYARADMFGFWNPQYGDALQDKFAESGIPTAADDKGFYIADHTDQQLKDLQSDDTEIVAVSPTIWADLTRSHQDFIASGLSKFKHQYAARKQKGQFGKWRSYVKLPDYAQDANIYMRMHFSPNPLGHPDPQVKTTAWLTLLTSIFALLTQWLYVGF